MPAIVWATYPLIAAAVVLGLVLIVAIIRAAMPIKFDVTIHHKTQETDDDENTAR